jgi:cysteine synthase A
MARHESVLDVIGRTPLIRLSRLAPEGVHVYVKLESMNPMGSVKDRMAKAVIERAEARGELRPGQTVIEATSGNTGIGLAMVCARKGYPLVVTMAESFSVERRKLLRFLGAKVVLTPASEKGTGMLEKAIELADEHGWYLCRQFENEANADVHTETTAREILEDFGGDPIHCFVSGFGTGGTLKGVARGLKASDPSTRIVAAEPDNAPLLGSGIAQERDAAGQPSASHPSFRPHLMQGWSPDFVSQITESAMAEGLVDEIVPVGGREAMRLSRELARREGIFVGTSSGATLAAALAVAKRSPAGTNIVCMLPDTGERYLSTPLFEDITEEMTEEELGLSKSTPGHRFDVQPAPAPAPARAKGDASKRLVEPEEVRLLDPEAERFVDEVVGSESIVLFALEWCEFCWSVRKLFAKIGVAHRSVDLDSVELQAGDLGGRIRSVLAARTGAVTIPQVFIGGEHVGGCTDLFDEYADGTLARRLGDLCIEHELAADFEPHTLLPGWLHSREAS